MLLVVSIVVVLLSILNVLDARQIEFINDCDFPIDVEKTDSESHVILTLDVGTSSTWTIPTTGWSGQFHRYNAAQDSSGYASATLAELTLATTECTQNCEWNMDWFDISIIPPGCSGTATCYQDCINPADPACDGYDVGMTLESVGCPIVITCDTKPCPGAYNFPSDTKTQACAKLGDFVITFCPSGSLTDLTPSQIDAASVGAAVTDSNTISPAEVPIGVAIGATVAGLVVLALVVLLVVFVVRRKRLEAEIV